MFLLAPRLLVPKVNSCPTDLGYSVELGNSFANGMRDMDSYALEDTEKYDSYYKNMFLSLGLRMSYCFSCLIRAFKLFWMDRKQRVCNYLHFAERRDHGRKSFFSVYYSSIRGILFSFLNNLCQADKRIDLVRQHKDSASKISKKLLLKELKAAFAHISKAKLIQVDNIQLQQDLLVYEARQVTKTTIFSYS